MDKNSKSPHTREGHCLEQRPIASTARRTSVLSDTRLRADALKQRWAKEASSVTNGQLCDSDAARSQ